MKDSFTELQISAGQLSIAGNFWLLTVHIYHVMVIVSIGFSKKSEYYLLLILSLFPRNSFK